MKVRLHKTGKVTDYDDGSAEWLVANGYATAMESKSSKSAPAPADDDDDDTEDGAPATPRRGRPPKAR